MGLMQKLAGNLKSVTTVATIDGVVGKVSFTKSPTDFSWNATRDAILKSKDVKVNVTLDKGTVQERSFRYVDVDGTVIEEGLSPANPVAKGKKVDRGGIDPVLTEPSTNGHATK